MEQQAVQAEERRQPAAVTSIGEGHPMQGLLDNTYQFKEIKRGAVLTGTIVRISPQEILVDVGSKSEGIISGRELEHLPADVLSELKVGEEVMTFVVSPEDRNGNIVLSLSRAQAERDWREAEELFKSQEVFEGQVAGFNKGGLIVKVGKVRGFVPASQLVGSHGVGRPEEPAEGEAEEAGRPDDRWQPLVGKKLQLKVIEMDRSRNRLILSERAAMRDWRKIQKEKLLSELHEGMHLKGRVISLADFGAFVDLGGADGLVHLSEISWKRVMHPREVLKVGQEVEVEVLNVDHDRKRIGLSLKRLEPDPWSLVENRYKVGQLVEGTITKLAKFGAFARIKDDDQIEGLIHISELADGRINHPKEVVKEGQVLTLRIIRIDAERRRLGLSLKRVDQAEYAEADWRQGLQEAFADEPPPAVVEDQALNQEASLPA
jgi:small subunit ribosomal protein S1